MKTVVVTGANGYIGSHVVEELLQHTEKFSVVAASLNDSALPADIRFVPLDIIAEAQNETLYERLGCPDICVHLAWRNGFQHNSLSHLVDFPRHFLFLKNLAEHGTRQFAVAGSFREYGSVNGMADEHAPVKPDNYYTLSKSMLKNALEICFAGKDICLQWLRPFTVYGDDARNQSILSKIIQWEAEGKDFFPFTDGNEQYDYISVEELARQIVAIISQTAVDGVIDCCSGKPTRLGDFVEGFLKENHFRIRPDYGAFKRREYDSPVIYGNRKKLDMILRDKKFYRGGTDGEDGSIRFLGTKRDSS